MEIHHIRNATMLLRLGEHRLLVDPMLGDAGSFPGFKLFGGGRCRNPLVPLPDGALEALDRATAVLVTHEHPDHLDKNAIRWIKERRLTVWASPVDAPNLAGKGLDARPLSDGALGFGVELVPARHGRGVVAWLMGPVAGLYLAHPQEPSLLITGDATLSPVLAEAVRRLRPEVVVAPAGAANFGFGPDILFSVDEQVELARLTEAEVVLNHLEALDHCPTTRRDLRTRMISEGLSERVHIPEDGEVLTFARRRTTPHVQPRSNLGLRPGFQKWITARFSGTSVLCGKFHVLSGEAAWFLARRDDAVVASLLQGGATQPGAAMTPVECIGTFHTGH